MGGGQVFHRIELLRNTGHGRRRQTTGLSDCCAKEATPQSLSPESLQGFSPSTDFMLLCYIGIERKKIDRRPIFFPRIPQQALSLTKGQLHGTVHTLATSFRKLIRTSLVSTPLTFILECGRRLLPGTSRTWISTRSTTSTLARLSSGIVFDRNTRHGSNVSPRVSFRPITRLAPSFSDTRLICSRPQSWRRME